MDVGVRGWMASAIVTAAVLVGSAEALSAQAAQTPPTGGAQATPPVIVVYRKAFMNANAQHMAALRALTSAEIGLPETVQRDHIRRHAAALQENAILMTKVVGRNFDLFPEGSLHAQSRATEKIWAEGEGGFGVEFAWRVHAFEETATDLLEAARSGAPVERIRAEVGRVQVTCGGCHASMRGPAPASTN